ncbi:uncharacterized protein LOC122014551 [Zingiber officinale]|uniref:Uncharacterized protein n=1 Tax=Zingiber officinale TaxID=94328 RepID=A0A8J5FFP2_ZINOF|nr:uncharacterized protein LOC122014551 [Zingiber officinale]KAG6483110.1 hypothetical protein ZIOFF_059750 [Zingiber officinale]
MSKVSSLLAEIDAYKERTSSLEVSLQASKEEERELIDALNANNDERNKIETLYDIQGKDHAKAQGMIENLPNKFKSVEVEMEIADEEFEGSVHREQELVEKLNYTRQQLVHQEKALEESTARRREMILMNEALVKDLEFKLQKATLSIKQKESQVIELLEKLKFLEEEKAIYKDEAIEANEISATLKAELEANAVKSVSLKNKVEELNHIILQYHSEFEEMALENEMMAGTNSKLQTSLEAHRLKLEELNQFLSLNHSEMEATARQLASNAKTHGKING